MKYTTNLTISGEIHKQLAKLHNKTEIPREKFKEWLAKQVLWQVHISVPKHYIHKAHFTVQIPNQQHQFDVLYMPYKKF